MSKTTAAAPSEGPQGVARVEDVAAVEATLREELDDLRAEVDELRAAPPAASPAPAAPASLPPSPPARRWSWSTVAVVFGVVVALVLLVVGAKAGVRHPEATP